MPQTPGTQGRPDRPLDRPRSTLSRLSSLLARLILSLPTSLLIANAVILTVLIDALLWYRWAVTGGAGWLFAAGVLSLLALTLLLHLARASHPHPLRR